MLWIVESHTGVGVARGAISRHIATNSGAAGDPRHVQTRDAWAKVLRNKSVRISRIALVASAADGFGSLVTEAVHSKCLGASQKVGVLLWGPIDPKP